jgi:hypothetical protein
VTALLAVALFLLGMHLSMRTIAALFRILDLWYTIGMAWPQVLRGLLVWGGGTMAIAALLPEGLRPFFLWGLVTFLGIFLGAYVIRFFILQAVAWRRAHSDPVR